jgi:hypothetical protein
MAREWTEAAIREELARLDAMTGLHGAALPISFGRGRCVLGQYSTAGGGAFRFSAVYFLDPEWPEEEALDVIRHEYAHHMDHVLYGGMGHGATWKQCCRTVGAIPLRCSSAQQEKYHRQKRAREAELAGRLDGYRPGDRIRHPVYGEGVIAEVTGEGLNRCVLVDFPDAGRRRLGLGWVDKNCRRCT